MTESFGGDPLEALRRVDPVDREQVPTDTTGPHARTLFQEVISMETMEKKSPSPAPRRGWRPVAALAGAAMVVAAVAIVAVNRGGGEEVIAGGEPISGSIASMCIEMYDISTVTGRDVAFDGTIVAIDGGLVTFEVEEWFKGGEGDTITLDATGLTGEETSISIGGPGMVQGGRYLVSGSDGFVWACGFTMTYDTEIARQWAEVFGG